MAARIGGDEFAVVLNEIENQNDAGIVASKLCKSLAEPFIIKDHPIEIGSSIGIVRFPSDIDNPLELIKRADIAMYRAKECGKNGYQYYKKELHDKHQFHLKLNRHIKGSIKRNEMQLVYQPIVDLKTNKILGLEVLTRWHSKEFNRTILPSEFIPIAESNGFIHELGSWILKTAFHQLCD